MRSPAAILIFICWSFPLLSQVSAVAELDTTQIMIGDQVGLTLRITKGPGDAIQRIDWSALEKSDTIEIVQQGTMDTISREPEYLMEQRLKITSFEPGQHWIPAIPVYYYSRQSGEGIVQTNELPLEVSTFPVETDTAALAPIKEIIKEPFRVQDLLPYLLAGVLLVGIPAGIYLLVSRKKKEEGLPGPEIIRPAHEVALEQLAALRAARAWERGEIKTFHSDLTHVVREYLENRYHVRALESTTDETIRQLQQIGLEISWQEQLRELLQGADLVKFAKAVPPASFHKEMLERAEQFVEYTKEEPADEEAVEAEEGSE